MTKDSRLQKSASFYHGKLVADWMSANPHKDFLPLNLIPPSRALTLPKGVEADRVADLGCAIDGKLNSSDQDERNKQRTTYRQRRDIESKLADYIDRHMDTFAMVSTLREAPGKLRACRRSGHWGERITGNKRKLVMGWDFKCGITRLCPDEARAEQRRLVRRYKPATMAWVREKPAARRIQKGVVTWPNIAPGELASMKRKMCAEFSAFIKKFPTVKGVLVSQEDPLSERGDWNIHLNVVLLIEGRLDWMDLIERWTEQTRHYFPDCSAEHFQIKMRELPKFDEPSLDAALREVIKYAVKHQDMANLDPNRFLEWWNAGLRFRRTRTYGVLFRVGKEAREAAQVVWYGRVWWDYRGGGAYAVERPVFLTQADNFPKGGAGKTTFRGGAPPPRWFPPAPPRPVVLRGGF